MSLPALPDAGAARPGRNAPGPWSLDLRSDRALAGLIASAGLAWAACAGFALSRAPALAVGVVAWVSVLTARAIWRDALRRGSGAPARLELAADGSLRIEASDGRCWQAQLGPGSRTLGAWALLRLEGGGWPGGRSLLVSPWACDSEALRRLRAGLRWGVRVPHPGGIGPRRGTSDRSERSGKHGPDRATANHARPPVARGGA